jgi:carboxyl-terminal processing protease
MNSARLWIVLLLAGQAAVAGDLAPRSYYGRIARIMAESVPKAHLTQQELDDGMAAKALDRYLNVLDFDHSYFLQPDVDRFRAEADQLDDQLREGHLEFAYQVYALFRQRALDRAEYVKELLGEDFDFTADERLGIKRKDAPWPADRAEWDELWRKKIKNEVVTLLVSQAMEKEAPPAAPAVAPGETAPPDTNTTAAAPAPAKPPAEVVLNRYQQFVTLLDGHDEEYILQLYLNSFTQAYDAHSEYFSPRAMEDFDINMTLSLSGIGALLSYEDGAAKVARIIPGGPAQRDGRLQVNDRIVAVGQGDEPPVDIMHWPLYKSVRLIRGLKGTTVVLSVIPAAEALTAKPRPIDLVRDEFKLEERTAKSRIKELPGRSPEQSYRLGIIRLPEFYADQEARKNGDAEATSSSADVKRLLQKLAGEGVDGVLVDLRNNGGGALPDAVEMAGYFIDRGPVVQVKYSRRLEYQSDPHPGAIYDGPVVLLVNRQSASASEILAAALQDYGRAVIVGDSKTHGKGTVQNLVRLQTDRPELGGLKLTTAGFYRINGGSTQFRGVHPDVVVPSAFDVMEIGESYLPNALTLSEIEPARFKASGDLSAIIPPLRRQSEERLRNNEPYTDYAAVVARLQEKVRREEVSLNLEERLQSARDDKQLEALVQRLSNETDDSLSESERSDDKDIILNEALLVLRDLVEAQSTPTLAAGAPAADRSPRPLPPPNGGRNVPLPPERL